MKTKEVFNNAKWIIICKIIQSILQLIIGMIAARYLGPSNYGLISYATSITAFAVPIMKLGLDAILVYQLVEEPEKEGEIMGTSLVLNVLMSILCIGGVAGFASIANFGETETIIVCVLYSVSMFFAALELAQYWFQYKLLSKYSSVIMLVAYLVVSAYKIFLLATQKSIYWFALSHSVEYGAIALLLFIFYFKKGGSKLTFSFPRVGKMLSKSKHYILASLMIVIIQNTDHVMITMMIGETENGYYAAAITCATIAQFVFTAMTDSFRPMILLHKKENEELFEKDVSRLYGIIVYLSFLQSIAFTVFAPLIVNIMYGAEYLPTITVLRILTWYFAFSCMGLVRNIWLLAEEKQKYLPAINFSGVVINIVLNAFMIPFWGACGAAFASFLTQLFMNFIFGFIFKPVRKNNMLMLKGLSPKFFVTELRCTVKEIFKKEK
ncbi:MAG: flippase [Ruminococcaceae bacterium]|nr:flippase [Oscillospiraceae bacterium]